MSKTQIPVVDLDNITDEYIQWLTHEAHMIYDNHIWYNMIAQVIMMDNDTDLEFTPSEVGWK
jgi:hypothetical protein